MFSPSYFIEQHAVITKYWLFRLDSPVAQWLGQLAMSFFVTLMIATGDYAYIDNFIVLHTCTEMFQSSNSKPILKPHWRSSVQANSDYQPLSWGLRSKHLFQFNRKGWHCRSILMITILQSEIQLRNIPYFRILWKVFFNCESFLIF